MRGSGLPAAANRQTTGQNRRTTIFSINLRPYDDHGLNVIKANDAIYYATFKAFGESGCLNMKIFKRFYYFNC